MVLRFRHVIRKATTKPSDWNPYLIIHFWQAFHVSKLPNWHMQEAHMKICPHMAPCQSITFLRKCHSFQLYTYPTIIAFHETTSCSAISWKTFTNIIPIQQISNNQYILENNIIFRQISKHCPSFLSSYIWHRCLKGISSYNIRK